MMNAFFRRAYKEYKRQIDLKKTFERQTDRIKSIIVAPPNKSNGIGGTDKIEAREKSLLLLFPLIEIAWANGRVARREMDAILKAADAYSLVKDEEGYRELTERLLSRPSPSAVGRLWQDFRHFLENLTVEERQTVIFALLAQASFVAEQSSDNVIGFLRGERICKDERDALRTVAEQLEAAKKAADERQELLETYQSVEREFYIARSIELFGDSGNHSGKSENNFIAADDEDFERLIPLVPLVKVAWAEGRITRRERELILTAAERMGIEPGSAAYQKLCDWLELHPTDEFYTESLERLQGEFEKLPEEERTLKRLDILSDCVNVAEASGGTSLYPAGGARICDEESTAVKRIATTLNGKKGTALAA